MSILLVHKQNQSALIHGSTAQYIFEITSYIPQSCNLGAYFSSKSHRLLVTFQFNRHACTTTRSLFNFWASF